MNDFAAAAMLRLMRLGLQHQGIELAAPALHGGAHVPLTDKRVLVDRLLRAHGPQVLLRIGEAVNVARDEPALVALSLARDPADLIARWQRLERYIHSRHRVVIVHAGDGHADLRHVSLARGQPPTAGEDLLVFGLLVALIERLGVEGLHAQIAGDDRVRWQHGAWLAQALPADVSTWSLRWRAPARPAPLPPSAGIDWVVRAHRLLEADPGRGWTLQTLAQDMATSPRSLQRHLAAHGSGFTQLLLAARLARSAHLLAESQQPPAQIGCVCGFSDQAHFTREFKRHSALTPGRFRAQFAAGR